MSRGPSSEIRSNHARTGRGSSARSPRNGERTRVEAGFTLIEILVVIAIIAVLSSIILSSLSTARSRGRDGRRVSDIKQIQLALLVYYDANHAYPTAIYGTQLTGAGYIPTMPLDPATGHQYAYVALQGASANATICASYHLGAKLEQNLSTPGSALSSDSDAMANGTYPGGDGPNCTNSSYVGTDISQVLSGNNGNDFNGTDPVYDVRP